MFVGRASELAELEGGLAQAGSGRGGLFLIAGEPGIGKSRLATELAVAARGQRAAIAWGRCWEAGGAPVLWPWREAFEALGLALPESGSIAARDPGEARFAFFREVAGALARHATRAPVVIVLEDLHAADRTSLLLLELLAAQLHTMPVLIAGTYRELEASLRAESADVIARLGRLGHVFQLPRLSAPEVAAIVRDTIDDADDDLVASVFETTHGNPLFVDEIVRDLRVHGARTGLPLGVREIIRQRLSLIPEPAREALEAAAVLGVQFAGADVARMLPAAPALLDEAVRAGVLVARARGLRFVHALYREALYADVPRSRREALHRAAARALAPGGAPLGEIAHHLLEAGPDSAAEAIDHGIRAAALALDTFAFEDAIALLERTRAALPPAADALRCRVLIALGEAALRSGDPTGRATCVDAAELARALGDATLLATAGLAYGSVFVMGAVDPVLVRMLEEALAGLPAADSALRARVMARLGAARQPSDMVQRAKDTTLVLEAIAMARRVGDRRELMRVLHSACGVLYGEADPSVRLPVARELERLAEDLGDAAGLLHARVRMATDLLEQADFAAYAELATRYEQLAARIGPAAAPWRVPLMRSMCAIAQDRFDESERLQAEARRLGGDEPRARRALGFHRIGFLRAAERHAELRASLAELRNLWLGMPYGVLLADARVASVLARVGAVDEVRAIIAALPDAAYPESVNCWALPEAAWATGDAVLAERVYPVLKTHATRCPMYWLDAEVAEPPAIRLVGYLDGLLGRWDACEGHAAEALAQVEAIGWRAPAARIRFELGDLLARCGRTPERARTLLGEARDAAQALGLVELVALIDRRHPSLAGASVIRAPSARSFVMTLEGEYYAIIGSRGTLRFKTSRGMQYLAALVDRPHTDVHVLELVGSAEHADRGDAGPVLDAEAMRAYRRRISELRDAIESAEMRGDSDGGEHARAELDAIAAELARGTGRGGKARRTDSAVDRARSAVQRRIKDALDRIAEQDPELGAWLRCSVQTGNYCKYRPAP